MLQIVRLTETGRTRARQFSLGIKQRLGIEITLLNNPKLLILDEPANGLDPVGIEEFRALTCLKVCSVSIQQYRTKWHNEVYSLFMVYELGAGYFGPTALQLWNRKNMDCSINDKRLVAGLNMIFSFGRTEKLWIEIENIDSPAVCPCGLCYNTKRATKEGGTMAASLMADVERPVLELVKNGLQKDGHFVTAYMSAAQVIIQIPYGK